MVTKTLVTVRRLSARERRALVALEAEYARRYLDVQRLLAVEADKARGVCRA